MCFNVFWTRVQVQTIRPLIQRAMIPGRTGKLNQQQSGWTHRRTTWTRSPAQVTLTSPSTPLSNLLFDCETLVSIFHSSEWVHHWLLITISYWSRPGGHQPWDVCFQPDDVTGAVLVPYSSRYLRTYFISIYADDIQLFSSMTPDETNPWGRANPNPRPPTQTPVSYLNLRTLNPLLHGTTSPLCETNGSQRFTE